MKVVTVFGARPQFIKAAPVSRALRAAGIDEICVHTGQHYDPELSADFFTELELPPPNYSLGVGSGPIEWQIEQMVEGITTIYRDEAPDLALVYGDTTSTLAGALATGPQKIKLAHVEAGLRTYERTLVEEQNRMITDHIAQIHLCPTETAIQNLANEHIIESAHLVGDTMIDALHWIRDRAKPPLVRGPESYVLVTLHRQANTDDPARLSALIEALCTLPLPVVFPLHPRTEKAMGATGLARLRAAGVMLGPPLSHGQMIGTLAGAKVLITDSGGLQKEACCLGVPCLTVRKRTEWVETIRAGWNRLVPQPDELAAAVANAVAPDAPETQHLFGDGHAAERIVAVLLGSQG